MSVQNEIDRIITAVEAAHTKVAEKGGTTARPYLVGNLADAIGTIPEGSDPVLQEMTVSPATSAQSVTPDDGYDGLSKVTVNAMPTATQATPSISVSSSGLITASATQTAGYVAAGTKSATKQLTTQAAQTITPSTSDKTISSGCYLTGTQTIKGDSNLVAANIAKGVSIFGVTGTHEGGGGEGSNGGGELKLLGSGSFRGNNNTVYTITHNLGVIPKICCVAKSGMNIANTLLQGFYVRHEGGYRCLTSGLTTKSGNYFTPATAYPSLSDEDWTDTTVVVRTGNSSVKFNSSTSVSYTWQLYG